MKICCDTCAWKEEENCLLKAGYSCFGMEYIHWKPKPGIIYNKYDNIINEILFHEFIKKEEMEMI